MKFLKGYGPVLILVALFIGLNLIFFFLCTAFNLVDVLSLSRNHPWGIFTSVFVHTDADHLLNNFYGFFAWTTLFVLFTSPFSRTRRRVYGTGLIFIVLFSSFLTNALELLIWEIRGTPSLISRGSSGLVYALLGATYSTATFRFLHELGKLGQRLQTIRRSPFSHSVWFAMMRGVLVISFVAVIPLRVFFAPEEFFGVAPNVDVLGHSLGFLIGLIGFSFLSLYLK